MRFPYRGMAALLFVLSALYFVLCILLAFVGLRGHTEQSTKFKEQSTIELNANLI